MTPLKLQLILEQLEKNYKAEGFLKESTDGSADNNTSNVGGSFAPLILPLIKKLYLDSLVPQIADVQPLTSPVGKVAALLSTYSGAGSSAESNLHPDNSFLLMVDSAAGLVVGNILSATETHTVTDSEGVETQVTTVIATYKIHYIEEDKLLVSIETGTHVPVTTDVLTSVAAPNSRTVEHVSRNRASLKKLLKGYSGVGVNGDGQYLGYSYGYDNSSNIKFLGFETRTLNVAASSRKLKSKFSQEQIEDMKNVYAENGVEMASVALANEIRQEIDKEVIAYLKFIAKLTTSKPLDLEKSIAAAPSGALQDVASDIVANIFLAAEQIVRDTKRNRRIFVMADPITAAFLQVSPFFVPSTKDSEDNIYRVGNIGTYPLFVDLYADTNENYVLVGYRGSNDNDGDSGVIYAPYTTTILSAVDTNFKENLLYIDRYAMARHPQDTGNIDQDNKWNIANEGNSDFFKMFIVDYGTTALTNFADTSIGVFT